MENVRISTNKMLSYRRETALRGVLVLAESGRLELETIFYGHYSGLRLTTVT